MKPGRRGSPKHMFDQLCGGDLGFDENEVDFNNFAPFNSLDLGPKLLQYGKGIVSLDLCTECFKSSNRIRLHDRISSRKMISST